MTLNAELNLTKVSMLAITLVFFAFMLSTLKSCQIEMRALQNEEAAIYLGSGCSKTLVNKVGSIWICDGDN